MILTQTSVTQVTSFDPDQPGGCNRRFWFERVHDLRPDQSNAQSDGAKGHALLAEYLVSGTMPAKRVKMGKAVTAAILRSLSAVDPSQRLPVPGADLLVEQRFDGQPMWRYPGGVDDEGDPVREYVPLDAQNTFHLGGLPWDGAIDLAFRRSDTPSVWDHKFHSDMAANPPTPSDRLIETVQLPIYVLTKIPSWPDAKQFEIAHNNVGKTVSHGSKIIRQIVDVDQILERGAHISGLVSQMQQVAQVISQEDVPFNRRSCHTWMGCAHQSICTAFKENKMALTAEEQAIFDDVPPSGPAPTLQVTDTKAAAIARMKAELAALESQATTPPPAAKRKLTIQDTEPELDATKPFGEQIPDSTGKKIVECEACGKALTTENVSKLRDGRTVHVECLSPKQSIVPPDAPASQPKLASEQPVEPKVTKAKEPKPVKITEMAAKLPSSVLVTPSAPTPNKNHSDATMHKLEEAMGLALSVLKEQPLEQAHEGLKLVTVPPKSTGVVTLTGTIADLRALLLGV